jgi:hypothetical protein
VRIISQRGLAYGANTYKVHKYCKFRTVSRPAPLSKRTSIAEHEGLCATNVGLKWGVHGAGPASSDAYEIVAQRQASRIEDGFASRIFRELGLGSCE